MKMNHSFIRVLCLIMILALVPVSAFAAPTATEMNQAGEVLGAASIVPTPDALSGGAVFDYPLYAATNSMDGAKIDAGSVRYTKEGLELGKETTQWRYQPTTPWCAFNYGSYLYIKVKVNDGGSILGKIYQPSNIHGHIRFLMTPSEIQFIDADGVHQNLQQCVPGTDWVELLLYRNKSNLETTWYMKGGSLKNWAKMTEPRSAWMNGSNNVGITWYGSSAVVNYCAVVEPSNVAQADPVYVDSIESIFGTDNYSGVYEHQIYSWYQHEDAHKYSDGSSNYGPSKYTDEGLALPSETISSIWYLDPKEKYWDGESITVVKGKLGVGTDVSSLYVTSPFYDKKRVKVDVHSSYVSAIAVNPTNTGSDLTSSAGFDFGTDWYELLVHSKMTGYDVYAKNDSTNGKWCLLLECYGYQNKAPSVGYLGITGNSDSFASPVLVKSITVYKKNSTADEAVPRGDIELGEGLEGTAIKNIAFGLGANSLERNVTWFSESSETGVVTWQKADDMKDGEFTAAAKTAVAIRDNYSITYTGGSHYNNKAVISGLEPETKYYYRLSNGNDETGLIPFKTGSNTSSFSFAFIADAQIGSGPQINQSVEEDGASWKRTLSQFVCDPVFEGIEFIMSGGDQINSDTNNPGSTNVYDHPQYDNYFDHPEMMSIANVGVLGNHDNYANGGHYLHYYEPNLDRNFGNSYNYADAYDGSDYYFVYDSMLCIVLNINSFDYNTGKLGSAELDLQHRKEAATHIAFIEKVLEETKDNKEILWKVILQHQSPYGGSYHNNYTATTSNATGYTRPEVWVNMNMRKYLFPTYYEKGIDLVLSGHDHTYTRSHVLKPVQNSDGSYSAEAEISPYSNTSGANYYTYADGTTTPTFTNWTDLNGVTYSDLKVSSVPVKVTDPDGVLYVTGSSASGAYCNDNIAPNHYAAVSLGHEEKLAQMGFDEGIRRQAVKIDVTPKSLTVTNYGLGGTKWDVDPSENILDTFTIEKTESIPVQGVALSKEETTIPVGSTEKLIARMIPANPDNEQMEWYSFDENIATVDADGVVKAVAPGTTIIRATTLEGGYIDVCAVTVVDAVPVTGVKFNPDSVYITLGKTKTLRAVIAPENATTKDVVWSSEDEEIATVSGNGHVKAVSLGTTQIKATTKDGGFVGTCTIVVEPPLREMTVTKVQTTNEKWIFEIKTDEKLTEGNVYLAAFDKNDQLLGIAVQKAEDSKSFIFEMKIPTNNVAYFKSFAWRENLRSLAWTGYLENK